MTFPGVGRPRETDTGCGFVISNPTDSMPALLTNSSSVSGSEEFRGAQEIGRHTRRLGQYNRRRRTYVRRHLDQLNDRVEVPESKERMTEEPDLLGTTPGTNTIRSRTRRHEGLGQDQRNPTITSPWTLRTLPSHRYIPSWTSTHPQESHEKDKKYGEDTE
ncbi:hypothetical protein SARC_01211 [Sphaeroforma arctica JP610]|uniref:Uncharacterized protein n=1 Tax=Sphaeroforma arctica JP610 TaxID=667725 RepID=A0A0L0GCM4_9EUKA|nr:hypothetical protein SARC_01211 [Sphaeroforma arctica JP610]KNC86631.1 hypothetical protein SARC_01211 [Sphaeroforma arctica JP610]|eukprot:XP_014160533.1 hypothetical protein SARC_01211 [Sphaeroforma arctica JP610]